MKFKYHAPWHQLKSVCLGRSYPESFYQDVRNSRIRDILQRIANETEEDYSRIEKILQSLGVQVHRPCIKPGNIMDWLDSQGRITYDQARTYSLIPKPPMQPRDCQLVVGETLLATNTDITHYSDIIDDDMIEHVDPASQFDAPLVTVIGRDLIVDRKDHPALDGLIASTFPGYRITAVDIGGHNDAVFAPVRPGCIISSHHKSCYEDSFPGWEVYHIPDQSWNALPAWRQLKHSNTTKWWMPGEETNEDFINFVDTWITHWLGYVSETVFDVNMLVIDTGTVLVNNYNEGVFDFLTKRGMEPIIAPFRHRFFWDGGIHCITSDLYREGDLETYL